jgi:hypothetical protein
MACLLTFNIQPTQMFAKYLRQRRRHRVNAAATFRLRSYRTAGGTLTSAPPGHPQSAARHSRSGRTGRNRAACAPAPRTASPSPSRAPRKPHSGCADGASSSHLFSASHSSPSQWPKPIQRSRAGSISVATAAHQREHGSRAVGEQHSMMPGLLPRSRNSLRLSVKHAVAGTAVCQPLSFCATVMTTLPFLCPLSTYRCASAVCFNG